MAQPSKFFKNNPDDKIWWVDDHEKVGEWLFSFDKKHIFNMFRDYPHELTDEQKKYSMKKIHTGLISSKIDIKKQRYRIVYLCFFITYMTII